MSRARFGRVKWGHALRGARHDSLEGWTLDGPRGVLATNVQAALTPGTRLRGLIGRTELASHEALVIRPCAQIHTVRVRFPIDAVFCDAGLVVLRVVPMQPGRVSPYVRGARCCFELHSGRAAEAGITPGVRIEMKPPEGSP